MPLLVVLFISQGCTVRLPEIVTTTLRSITRGLGRHLLFWCLSVFDHFDIQWPRVFALICWDWLFSFHNIATASVHLADSEFSADPSGFWATYSGGNIDFVCLPCDKFCSDFCSSLISGVGSLFLLLALGSFCQFTYNFWCTVTLFLLALALERRGALQLSFITISISFLYYTALRAVASIFDIFNILIDHPGTDFETAKRFLLQQRKPGPKSRCRAILLHLVCCIFTISTLRLYRGEGCSCSMTTAEAPLPSWLQDLPIDGAKLHGPRPTACSETLSWTPSDSFVKKRSLRRAYHRACRDGLSWYRGRCYIPSDFPLQLRQQCTHQHSNRSLRPSGHVDLCRHNTQQSGRRRFKFLTWNVASLSQSKLDEIRLWALDMDLSALILVETRWSWSGEWQDSNWQYVHSGDPKSRGSGILVMIRRKVRSNSDIRWQECMPGRLVHVQLRLQPRYIDILACYQFCFNSHSARQADRSRWWECLETSLRHLPTRHVLALAGDFNCSLPMENSHVGHKGYHWQDGMREGTHHGDMDIFMHILRTFDLNVLNSWHPQNGPTYIGLNCSSRIDFCITRQHMADGASRDVKYLWDAPVKESKTDHCPILFQLNRYWIPAPLSPDNRGCTFQQRVKCRFAYLEDTAAWRDFITQTRETAFQHMQQSDPHDVTIIQHLHDLILTDFHQFFPASTSMRDDVWYDTAPKIYCKWDHRTAYLTISKRMSHGIFDLRITLQFWYHAVRFTTLAKSQRRHSRLVRMHRFSEIIAEAQTAADRHNSFQLFQLIIPTDWKLE